MLVTFSNISTAPIFLSTLGITINPGASAVAERTVAQLQAEQVLLAYVAGGQITLSYATETGDLANLPLAPVGQSNPGTGGGGSGSNVFTYRESEPSPAGNVYATFAAAYAAAAATGVPATIVIDDSLEDCFIPEGAGNFDLRLITLTGLATGIPDPAVVLSIYDGVSWNQGFGRITGNLWVMTSFESTPFLGVLTGTLYMQVDDQALLATDSEGATFDCSQENNPTISLTLDSGILITNEGSGPFFYTGEGDPEITITLNGTSYTDPGLISGSGGSLTVWWNSINVLYGPPPSSFPSYSGSINNYYTAEAGLLNPFTGNGTFPSVGSNYPFITTGTMYFDEGTSQPYWWTGSAWVTYPAPNPPSGVELLNATAGSSQGSPVGNLSLSVQVSILVNTTGSAAFWHLPDGSDGMIKEIVSGGNYGSDLVSNAYIGITSTNNAYGTNDLLDLNGSGYSVRLVWSTAGGGWVAVSTCANASTQWD